MMTPKAEKIRDRVLAKMKTGKKLNKAESRFTRLVLIGRLLKTKSGQDKLIDAVVRRYTQLKLKPSLTEKKIAKTVKEMAETYGAAYAKRAEKVLTTARKKIKALAAAA